MLVLIVASPVIKTGWWGFVCAGLLAAGFFLFVLGRGMASGECTSGFLGTCSAKGKIWGAVEVLGAVLLAGNLLWVVGAGFLWLFRLFTSTTKRLIEWAASKDQ